MKSKQLSASEEAAIAHVSQRAFHRSYVVPPNPAYLRHSPIRITYADNDYRESPNGPVLLFFGGIFGTRYAVTGEIDALARHYKLRLIAPDKCGFGGTGGEKTEDRIRTWIDLVAELLKHLNIKHVAMASHSCGTMYLFNMILVHRYLLHPKHPFVVFLVPWVHPNQSATLKIVSLVPNALVANLSTIAKNTIPAINKALNFSSSIITHTSKTKPKQGVQEEDLPEGISAEARAMQRYVGSLCMSYVFEENINGANQEAMLCLRRGFREDQTAWSLFEDYDEGVRKIADSETNRTAILTQTEPELQHQRQKLKVRAYFADEDSMVGPQGAQWFEKCWQQQGVSKAVDYESKTVPDSGHDTIVESEKGIVAEVFNAIVQSFEED